MLKEELVVKKDAVQNAQSSQTNPRRDNIDGGESRTRDQAPGDERR